MISTTSVAAARLDCSPVRAAGLLGELAGVRVDEQAGVAWIVDPGLAVAVRDAFAGEGQLRPVQQMHAGGLPRPVRHPAVAGGRGRSARGAAGGR